ncbi:MAG TPA: hypothetical protein PLL92_04545 [Alicycliphilus sp.]|nr:hypothetical protein [Alicycliphilus sp.]
MLATTVILTACANLNAVRDFSKESAQLAAYRDATEKMVANPAELLRQAPAVATFEQDRARLKIQAEERARLRDSMLKMHNVVAGYMAALAKLAGDETFSFTSSINEVKGALVESTQFGINADTVKTYASLVTTVSNWLTAAIQAKQVRTMVSKNGEAMDRMLAGLEDVSLSVAGILQQDRQILLNYRDFYEDGFKFDFGPEQPPPNNLSTTQLSNYEEQRNVAIRRREAARILVERSNAAMVATQQEAVDSANAAVSGVRTVRQGHNDMRRNVEQLTSEQLTTKLRQLIGDLQDVRANLKKL